MGGDSRGGGGPIYLHTPAKIVGTLVLAFQFGWGLNRVAVHCRQILSVSFDSVRSTHHDSGLPWEIDHPHEEIRFRHRSLDAT